MRLAARLLLDLGGVKQSGDHCRRADANGHAGLHQLASALLVRAVGFVIGVAHTEISMASVKDWEAA